MTEAGAPPVEPAWDNTIGAVLIGVLLAYVLMGTVIVQGYNYYQKFPKDELWLKSLVAVVILLEIGQSICLGHVLYFFVVKNFTNPAALLTPPKSFGFDTLLTVLVKVIVQWFFCMRIYRLSQNPIIPLIGAFITLIALGFGLVVTVDSIVIKVVPIFEAKVVWILPTSLTISLVADVYIAAALVWRLYSERNEEIQSTARVIDKLIAWSIQTGTITSITGLAQLILFVTMRNNYIWIAFYSMLPKLYSNSLLASLNGRVILRELGKSAPIELSGAVRSGRSYGLSSGTGVAFKTISYTDSTATQSAVAYNLELNPTEAVFNRGFSKPSDAG